MGTRGASMSWALKLVQGWYYGKSLPGWCCLQSYQPCRVLATSIDTNGDTRCISEEELQFWGGHLLSWALAYLLRNKLSYHDHVQTHILTHVLTIIVRPMFWWAYTDPCFDDHIQIHILMIIFRSMFWWSYSDPCFDDYTQTHVLTFSMFWWLYSDPIFWWSKHSDPCFDQLAC
jgi:hypothetical protein